MSLLEHRPPISDSPPWWRSPVWLGAGLVGVVHIALIGMLLTSLTTGTFTLPSQREVFFFFHPADKPKPPNKTALIPPTQPTAPLFHYEPPPPPPTAAAPPDAKGLGLALFGCAPENLANLSVEDRAHCSGRLGVASLQSAVPGAFQMPGLQAARWRAAIVVRNTPLSVPCVSISKDTSLAGEIGVSRGTPPTKLMIDPLCLQLLRMQDFDR